MIFEALNTAADHGELILTDGGMLHYHKRRDGILTVREIIVVPARRGQHIGRWLISRMLRDHPQAVAMVARCPTDLPSNAFWRRLGFTLIATSGGKRPINTWKKDLSHLSTAPAATLSLPMLL